MAYAHIINGLYQTLSPLLFKMDAEDAHHLAIKVLKLGVARLPDAYDNPMLETTVAGLKFRHPIGMAAGFDKQAEVVDALFTLNNALVEVGSITPRPQAGNPRPRLFRDVGTAAVLNRFGFNSDGADICLDRIQSFQSQHRANPLDKKGRPRGVMGINLGKNKETEDAAVDYIHGMKVFAPWADYITVNVSSPNTAGLRDLQRREPLQDLLSRVMAARNETGVKPPVFVKIAPDITPEQMDDVAEVALAVQIDGMVVGNTTLQRPAYLPSRFASETGGLSGVPLRDLSTSVLAAMYRRVGKHMPIIGCGGVSNGADAYEKIRNGASLVQYYSAMVFEGPALADVMVRDLVEYLRRDGFAHVRDAVGVDVQ